MRFVLPERTSLYAKVAVAIAFDAAWAIPLNLLVVARGRAPTSLLWTQNLGRRVAVKWMTPGLDAETVSLRSAAVEVWEMIKRGDLPGE
jgi:hypothetical protein